MSDLFVASLTLVHSVFFSSIQCFLLFNSLFDHSVFDSSVYFSVLILELYSRYFDPHKQQPSGSQKTSFSRQRYLCLSIGSERPIVIIDIEGYLELISPNGLS